jgi:hypothetical protein
MVFNHSFVRNIILITAVFSFGCASVFVSKPEFSSQAPSKSLEEVAETKITKIRLEVSNSLPQFVGNKELAEKEMAEISKKYFIKEFNDKYHIQVVDDPAVPLWSIQVVSEKTGGFGYVWLSSLTLTLIPSWRNFKQSIKVYKGTAKGEPVFTYNAEVTRAIHLFLLFFPPYSIKGLDTYHLKEPTPYIAQVINGKLK